MNDLDLTALAVDGVVPVVTRGEPIEKNGITYDTELWVFDHGKEGITKIFKEIPRSTNEEERARNAEQAAWAVRQMKLSAMGVSV